MIDIHAHILPRVDDGPDTWDESLALLRRGEQDGIEGVVCTSHVVDRLDARLEKNLRDKFEDLKRLARNEGLKIKLWLGSEIHIQATFNTGSPVATIDGKGKYILLELPLGEIPRGVGDIFFDLSVQGITVILAHPERNTVILNKPHVAFDFVQRGILLQINAGSLTGVFGRRVKKRAWSFFKHHMVHFVASDCHRPGSRGLTLSRAYRNVTKRFGKETAEMVFRTNAARAIEGEAIEPPMPLPFDEGRKKKKRW